MMKKSNRLYIFIILTTLLTLSHTTTIRSCGTLAEGIYYIEIVSNQDPCLRISSNTVIEGGTINATVEFGDMALIVEGDNVVIENLTITNFRETAIYVNGKNVKIKNTTILGPRDKGSYGIVVKGKNVSITNTTVLNYNIHLSLSTPLSNVINGVFSSYEELSLTPPSPPISLYSVGGSYTGGRNYKRFSISYELNDDKLHIKVQYRGKAVERARVYIAKLYSDTNYVIVDILETDENGTITYTFPSEGKYFFEVRLRGFYPYTSEVFQIKKTQSKNFSISTLKTNQDERKENNENNNYEQNNSFNNITKDMLYNYQHYMQNENVSLSKNDSSNQLKGVSFAIYMVNETEKNETQIKKENKTAEKNFTTFLTILLIFALIVILKAIYQKLKKPEKNPFKKFRKR